ncbi:MAG: hypothetical protein JWM47_3310 [Acidimicrobiales bacterium]|nr:hypothetical protein [Acidimicrobiales bacterium]
MRMIVNHQPVRGVRTTARTRRDGGYVLITFALLFVPLLLMAGLAIDIGFWYNEASDIQKATDAAALAGVVWLPDEIKARQVALDVAKMNGYDDASPNIAVTVTKSTKAPRRLKVSITDDRIGSFFYENLGGRKIALTRTSFAEYVTPVPMGSPRNYFGTGKLITGNQELLYQSVNPFCTDKIQGDRHQSRYFGGTCTSALNTDYRDTGYELYIEAPANRTSAIEVRLYDARYATTDLSYQVPAGETCTNTYTYPTDPAAGWTISTTTAPIVGPKQYQTRNSNTTTTWNPIVTLNDGQSFTPVASRARWRVPETTTPTCSPAFTTVPDNHIDMTLSNTKQEQYTYSLYSADSTATDDTDNPLKCSMAFDATTAFDPGTYLGSLRWNTLCNISTTDPSGKYVLRVRNNGAVGNTASGANQYGVVARYASSTDDGLCDGRTDPLCPRVYGKDAISVYANTSASTASFFMAQIGQEHANKKLRLDLWDPGEGGNNIQIMKPTGPDTWAATPFTYKVGTAAPVSTSTLDVTGSVFNGKLVEITVDLAGYIPPTNNDWWQIKYAFTSGTVTDRTTWSARIIGDPVHILEEN